MRTSLNGHNSVALDGSRFMDYVSLTKPELTFLSVLTALAGYLLAAEGRVQPWAMATALTGIALVGGGAGALNQYLERRWDALMRRTDHRPLPSGRLLPHHALIFGVASSLLGLLDLALFTNMTTASLGAATLVTYLFLYTPLKRLTPWATIVGAIPGAIPPVMGWTAAGRAVDVTALFIAAVLFFWQVPHFLSLAWIYRRDYANAGYRLLATGDESGALTARECLAFMSALMLIIGVPCITGFSGVVYMAGAFLVTGIFLATGWVHLIETSNRSARLMFVGSLIYLPTLMGLMVIDRLLLPA